MAQTASDILIEVLQNRQHVRGRGERTVRHVVVFDLSSQQWLTASSLQADASGTPHYRRR